MISTHPRPLSLTTSSCQFPKPAPPLFVTSMRCKRTTIISVFRQADFAILCADSQEVVSDYAKKETNKIKLINFYGNWSMATAGAGDATFIVSVR